jgi:hypothetical protein
LQNHEFFGIYLNSFCNNFTFENIYIFKITGILIGIAFQTFDLKFFFEALIAKP